MADGPLDTSFVFDATLPFVQGGANDGALNMSRTITEIEAATGASKIDIDNWIRRQALATEYTSPPRGLSREYSYENALELGFMGALVAGGVKPSRAAPYVASLLRNVQAGRPREFLVFRGADPTTAVATDEIKPATLDQLGPAGDAPGVITLIELGKIIRRVERAFEEV